MMGNASHPAVHSELFSTALRELELSAVECLAKVSFSQAHQSVLTAGFSTIVIAWFYTERLDFSGAIVVINALGEPDEPYQLFAGKIMSSHYVAAKASQELHASFL